MFRRSCAGLLIIIMVGVLMISASGPITYNKPTGRAYITFVLSDIWDYPDEHGQGVYAVTVYQYLSSQWYNMANFYYDNATDTFPINITGPIQLQLRGWINNTLVDAIDLDDGENYFSYNVSVYSATGQLLVFEPDGSVNWSNDYVGGTMFLYHYNTTTLGFNPADGQNYRLRVTYEIYYPT